MVIETDGARWYIPVNRGVWMPWGIQHSVEAYGRVEMKTAFIRRDRTRGMPKDPCEILISALLRELLLHASTVDTTSPGTPTAHLLALIRNQCRVVEESPLSVPLISDRRIAPIAERLLAHPSDRTTLDQWASHLSLSTRTITRRISRETGMTFSQWTRQIALMHALRLLGEGKTTLEVSLELGYDNPGSFIQLFKRRFGVTPQSYFL